MAPSRKNQGASLDGINFSTPCLFVCRYRI